MTAFLHVFLYRFYYMVKMCIFIKHFFMNRVSRQKPHGPEMKGPSTFCLRPIMSLGHPLVVQKTIGHES